MNRQYINDINARFWIGVWILVIGMMIGFILLPFMPNEDKDCPTSDTIYQRDTIVHNDDSCKTAMEKYCDPEHYSVTKINGVLYVHKRIKSIRDDR